MTDPPSPSHAPSRTATLAYVLGGMAALLLAGVIAVYVAAHFRDQVMRTSEPLTDSLAGESPFNSMCQDILTRLGHEDVTVKAALAELAPFADRESGRLLILGLEAWQDLQDIVAQGEETDYRELAERSRAYQEFTAHFLGERTVDEEFLYPTLLARDLVIYVFNHRDAILLHEKDWYQSNSEKESAEMFVADAMAVHDYLRGLARASFGEDAYYRDPVNLNVFCVAIYVRARQAGRFSGSSEKLADTLRLAMDNDFRVPGEKGRWLATFRTTLADYLESSLDMTLGIDPPHVAGRWLQ